MKGEHMKQARSKSIETQRKVLELSIQRASKVKAEMEELSRRNWTGGEMPLVSPVKEVAAQLGIALDAMRQADRHMTGLVRTLQVKGK